MIYTVQQGDSPARIAQRLTGSAARMRELLDANPAKPRAQHGQAVTFRELAIGERLAVPRAWARFGGAAHGVGSPPWGVGATSDGALLLAAQAVTAENLPWGGACPVDSVVQAFQTAWNADLSAGTDPAMASATDNSGNVIGQLTVDGKYGAETAAAVAAALGSQSPTPCASYTTGGGGTVTYSAGVIAAAQALDAYLATTGCSMCGAVGAQPTPGDAGGALVSAFKNAILVTPGDTSNAAPTVTGSTINMTSAACQQAFGPGTIADLSAVLGAAKRSTVTCTDSNCNCLAASNPQPAPQPPACPAGQVNDTVTYQCVAPCSNGSAPANGVCSGGVTPPAPSAASSSSAGLIAGVLLVGTGAVAVGYAVKHRKKKAHAYA